MIRNRNGFTLLEILLAVSIMAVVSTVTFLSFSTVLTAWRKGVTLADDIDHGDFIIEQLVMALRSAYYPDTKGVFSIYGFWQEDNEDGPYSSDVISWVKIGSALVGKDSSFSESPHRVNFFVGEDDRGESRMALKAWLLHGQSEDFNPDDVEVIYLPGKVIGFNCRTAYRKVDDEIEWKDEWEYTNKLPTVIEITIYMKPIDEGEEPVEIKRIIGIPVAPLAWR